MIAPFWSDIDLSVGGNSVVYYRQHGRDTGDQRDTVVLDAAAELIRRDSADVDFTPSSVTKITWKDVAPYPSVNTAATRVSTVSQSLYNIANLPRTHL